ncbi:MAG: hypothetical protein QOH66_1438, partial [Actinomycetota bacterium]|nr:hypothetical protein [Actinomycetota bacterium]
SGTLLASLPLRNHRGVDTEFFVIVFPRKSKERVRNLLLRESEGSRWAFRNRFGVDAAR